MRTNVSAHQGNESANQGRGIESLLTSGEILPTQLPSRSNWSPERKLAGAVFASALVEVRDRQGDPSYRLRVKRALEWIESEDIEWPFSFIPLCHLFGLEPEYVRSVVQRWVREGSAHQPRQSSAHRHAA
ncbi:MAG TPA: hypothetical protein VMW17_00215 [Candidatus Binatia bacterium]|nr:hypothetical protein [Candidatus Binatia bacterium]